MSRERLKNGDGKGECNDDLHVFVNNQRIYIPNEGNGFVIRGVDVRTKLHPEQYHYRLESADHRDPNPKVYSDSDVIPSGTRLWAVPPSGFLGDDL